MSIERNIRDVMEEIENGNEMLGNDVRRLAVNAIKKGEGSEAWKEYMSMFGKSDIQLARLMPTDSTKDVYEMDVPRTYLVGNGTCGAETTRFQLILGVDDKLDQDLS